MDSTIIAALIGVLGALIVDIFANIRGWKKTKALIEDSFKSFENHIGISDDITLRKDIENNFNDLSSQIGTQDHHNKSLSVQHDEIRELINSKSKEQSGMFADQMDVIKEINERGKEEEYKRKAHEEVMSQRTLESKEVAESFSYLMRRTAELEFELKKNAEESNVKSEEIKRLNNEIDKLRKQLYNLYNNVRKDKPEKDEPLNLTKSKSKGI